MSYICLFVCMYNEDLALNNHQWLICPGCIAIIIMISITTVYIQMQILGNTKHRRTQIHWRLSTHRLLLISDFGSSTRGKRQFLKDFRNHTMLTTPWSELNSPLQLSAIEAGNPTLSLHCPKSTQSFSKFSNSQDHRFRAWRHSHSSPISYVGFIMTIVIVISFAHERKLYPMLCTWTKSRIVQSLTKLNDKI